MAAPPLPDGDLLDLAAALVDIDSESYNEGPITDLIEAELRSLGHLSVDRVGDNVVARTQLARPRRIVLAGHTDTVPANNNAGARIDGDVLWGLGASDMKGGLAVMLALARALEAPAADVSYVFYAREEVDAADNGLRELAAARPDLLEADVALLGEPTAGVVEAGCQGTMRLRVTLAGARAHTARPWTGRNAIHRLAAVLAEVSAYEERRPVVQGCEYREALQAVAVSGGVAGNVVPDRAEVKLNHRFAPDRTPEQAEAHVRALLDGVLEDGDTVELVDMAAPSGSRPRRSAADGAHRAQRRAGEGQAGMDRRCVLLGPRRASVELRSRRSTARAHCRRAPAPRPARRSARSAAGLASRRRLSDSPAAPRRRR